MKHEHRKYYNGSPTLLRLEQEKRDALCNLCLQCTEEQHRIFRLMYSPKDLTLDIKSITDDMELKHIDNTTM